MSFEQQLREQLVRAERPRKPAPGISLLLAASVTLALVVGALFLVVLRPSTNHSKSATGGQAKNTFSVLNTPPVPLPRGLLGFPRPGGPQGLQEGEAHRVPTHGLPGPLFVVVSAGREQICVIGAPGQECAGYTQAQRQPLLQIVWCGQPTRGHNYAVLFGLAPDGITEAVINGPGGFARAVPLLHNVLYMTVPLRTGMTLHWVGSPRQQPVPLTGYSPDQRCAGRP